VVPGPAAEKSGRKLGGQGSPFIHDPKVMLAKTPASEFHHEHRHT